MTKSISLDAFNKLVADATNATNSICEKTLQKYDADLEHISAEFDQKICTAEKEFLAKRIAVKVEYEAIVSTVNGEYEAKIDAVEREYEKLITQVEEKYDQTVEAVISLTKLKEKKIKNISVEKRERIAAIETEKTRSLGNLGDDKIRTLVNFEATKGHRISIRDAWLAQEMEGHYQSKKTMFEMFSNASLEFATNPSKLNKCMICDSMSDLEAAHIISIDLFDKDEYCQYLKDSSKGSTDIRNVITMDRNCHNWFDSNKFQILYHENEKYICQYTDQTLFNSIGGVSDGSTVKKEIEFNCDESDRPSPQLLNMRLSLQLKDNASVYEDCAEEEVDEIDQKTLSVGSNERIDMLYFGRSAATNRK